MFQQYDYTQMFDTIDLMEACSDMFDTGVKNEHLCLLYETNKKIEMKVNTVYGQTDTQTIRRSVLQGDSWGPSFASVQCDKIGQAAHQSGLHNLYKKKVPIGPLGMIDDLVGVTEAGFRAQEMNSFINLKSAEKKIPVWFFQVQNYAGG